MRDKAIVTMCFGNEYEELAKVTHSVIQKYADKIDADFIVINEKKVSKIYFHYEKFQINELLGKYSRILYLDTDLIIRPDTPNLFEIVPEYKIGLFNEGRFWPCVHIIRDAAVKYNISLPKWERQYYNTGVMVISRLHRHLFKKPLREFDSYQGNGQYEQPYLNLKIIADNYEVHDIGYKFNRVSKMDKLTGEHRLSSYIVHYAGATPHTYLPLLESDIKSWKETAPDYFYPRNIHVNIGGGLGDQVATEPVIRFMCENVYPKDNVRIKTDFPRMFKHLPVKIYNETEAKKETTMYYKMETMPSPETSLWQHLAHTLSHTVDFTSISTLRRTLPNLDKQIRLQVDFQDITSLTNVLGIRNFIEMILVHPGRGWKSKTFPSEFWQNVIDGLAEKGLPVAVIGKYVSEDQGLVDIKCSDKVLDLRNMLNLDELIALISQARVLLSNDSAPIHIAGAFDNWIVLVPSCKHPDHVLPYRNGTINYKTLSLYKKLTIDAIDSSPTQVDGQTIDYVVGDIKDYLPDVETVVDAVESCFNSEK